MSDNCSEKLTQAVVMAINSKSLLSSIVNFLSNSRSLCLKLIFFYVLFYAELKPTSSATENCFVSYFYNSRTKNRHIIASVLKTEESHFVVSGENQIPHLKTDQIYLLCLPCYI